MRIILLFLMMFVFNTYAAPILKDYFNNDLVFCKKYYLGSYNMMTFSKHIFPKTYIFDGWQYLSIGSLNTYYLGQSIQLIPPSFQKKSCGDLVKENDLFHIKFNQINKNTKGYDYLIWDYKSKSYYLTNILNINNIISMFYLLYYGNNKNNIAYLLSNKYHNKEYVSCDYNYWCYTNSDKKMSSLFTFYPVQN